MSTALQPKVIFTQGYPAAQIKQHVLPAASGNAVTAGLIGYNVADEWVLGIPDVRKEPHVFRNGVDYPDAGRDAHDSSYVQVGGGDIQGISFDNGGLEFETTGFAGTPAINEGLYAHTDGKLTVCQDASGVTVTASKVVVAYCVKASHLINGVAYIKVRPAKTYVLTA